MWYYREVGVVLLLSVAIALRIGAQVPTRRGSVSVPTIANLQPAWTPSQRLQLASAASRLIGTRPDPVYQFSRVAGAVRLRDRRIVVADAGSRELRFYDAFGTYLASRGRRGEGPGEFQGLSLLQVTEGDSLLAGSSGTLSRFTSEGKFVGRVDPLQPPAPLPIGEKFILGTFAGGKTIMGALPRPVESNRLPRDGLRWTDSIHLALIGAENELLTVLGRFPSRVMEWRGTDLLQPWFAPKAITASDGKRFFLGFGSDYMVRVFGPTGQLERIIRRRWAAKRVDMSAWLRGQPAAADDAKRADLRKELLSAPREESLPAFEAMVVDRGGKLWVRESQLSDYLPQGETKPEPSNWSVFGVDGRWLGDVRMPARFRPTDIGADYVLGVAQDADGVDTVVLYKLGRAG